MYPITSAVKALFDAEQRKVLRITGTDKNGASISITDDNAMQGSFSIDRYACNGEKLEIGTAISSEMKVKLNNVDGAFDDIVFEGAELFVEIGIADWSQTTPTITYIPCGYFTPDEQPRSFEIITLNALDRMTNFDEVQQMSLVPWTTDQGATVTDNYGNIIYFVRDFELPLTVAQLIGKIAMRCNVPFDQSLTGFPNYNYTITALPTTDQDITFRNLIQWCAGIMGTNAWIDWDGKLRFSWFNNTTGYTSTISSRYSSDLYEDAVQITGVQYVASDESRTSYLFGTDVYALDVSTNGLINTDNAATVLSNIYNAVHNFAYTPFSASVIAAPYLWPMDRVTFTDKDNVGHVSSLTNVNFRLNGKTAIQAKGETALTNSRATPSAFTAGQKKELLRVSEAMNDAVDHATEMITGGLGGNVVIGMNETTGQPEEILIMDTADKSTAVNVWRFNSGGLGHSSNGYDGPFNDIALTADGQINANVITTGSLSANRISGGTLTLGGINNINGSLLIYSETNNLIGSWDNSGISIVDGTFECGAYEWEIDSSVQQDEPNDYFKVKIEKNGIWFFKNGLQCGGLYISNETTGEIDPETGQLVTYPMIHLTGYNGYIAHLN